MAPGVTTSADIATRFVAAFVLFLALAALKTYPLLLHFGSRLVAGPDALLVTWILAWDVHALATQPWRLFEANLSYPIEHSLAFSDHLLGALPISAPAYLLTGNPVVATNTLFLLSFALAGFAAFSLAHYWTRSFWPSLVAGVLYGFAPLRLSQIGHVQLLTFFWAPLVLLFLDRFLRERGWRDLAMFALFYWLQVLSAAYFAFMITTAVVLYAGYYVLAGDRTIIRQPGMAARVLAFGGASLAVLLPAHLPYLLVSRSWHAAFTTGAMSGFSADVQSYLSATGLLNDWYVALFRSVYPAGAHERLLFPGLLMPALLILGSRLGLDGLAPVECRRLRIVSWLIIVVGFVLSLGPALVLWGWRTGFPLPYLGLYYAVPGWAGMRVPARFAFLIVLAAIPLTALGAAAVIERVARKLGNADRQRAAPGLVGLVLITLFFLELGAKPLPLQSVPTGAEIPEVYRWLATARPGPIIEIPLDPFAADQKYLYFSTVHWQPIINGSSGFTPPNHEAVKSLLATLPNPRALEYAAALGLGAIVVHTRDLTPAARERWTARERGSSALRRLAAFGDDVVYAVPPATTTSQLSGRLETPDWISNAGSALVGLALEGAPDRTWSHPRPNGVSEAVVEWSASTGRQITTSRLFVPLPLAIGAAETVALPLQLSPPAQPGRYTIRVSLPTRSLTLAPREIEVRARSVATSADAPDQLAATYALQRGPSTSDAAGAIRLRIDATNTGSAVWLAKGRQKRGGVRLHWRWTRDGQEIDDGRGFAPVRYDVYPGQHYLFDVMIDSPLAPGRYVLDVGLVSERVAAFAERGAPPLRLSVDVGAGSL